MLREGDRVRICIATRGVAAGSLGTIQHVFLTMANTYDVQLDEPFGPSILSGEVLEPVDDKQEQVP